MTLSQKKHIPCVLSIAGTDPTGGAGIQADIKAISATGGYAASVITALVAQNTKGVQQIEPISSSFIKKQLDAVLDDLDIQAIKIGMVYDKDCINVITEALNAYKPCHVVYDPVMVAKDGSILLPLDILTHIKTTLLPHIHLLTPNLFEANHLLNKTIQTSSDMETAAIEMGHQFNTSILIKGGHLTEEKAPDVLYSRQTNRCYWFEAERVYTHHTHGTGCSFSSAIASYLAQHHSMYNAIAMAKDYLTKSIQGGCYLNIGQGNGPVDHFYFLRNRISHTECALDKT